MAQACTTGMGEALLDRLLLTPARLAAIANDVRQVCCLNDPVGQVLDGSLLDSGLKLERRRVPLGVIGVIYEARPNVTLDVASLCLKTGKAMIPRGGAGLHQLCREQSTIPVITGDIGVCHIYVDDSVDFDKAFAVIENAKIQRPSACNSLETLLVNRHIAEEFLSALNTLYVRWTLRRCTSTPAPVSPTAASSVWGRSGGQHSEAACSWPDGVGCADHLQVDRLRRRSGMQLSSTQTR